jgi:hypothetical protein
MRITPETMEVMRAFWKFVEPNLPSILDEFYQHVAAEPHLRAMVGDNIRSPNAPKPIRLHASSRLNDN